MVCCLVIEDLISFVCDIEDHSQLSLQASHGGHKVRVRPQFRTSRSTITGHISGLSPRWPLFPPVSAHTKFLERANTHLIIVAQYRFSDEHGFAKPNDERALKLMDYAAKSAMIEFKDIVLAFGESDEFR